MIPLLKSPRTGDKGSWDVECSGVSLKGRSPNKGVRSLGGRKHKLSSEMREAPGNANFSFSKDPPGGGYQMQLNVTGTSAGLMVEVFALAPEVLFGQ